MRWLTDVRRFPAAAALVLATTAAAPRSAGAREQPGALQLLDVPYIAQTEALCGGAAAAMVLRFWGATGVHAETFADLVVPSAEGIRGDDLARGIEARGWTVKTFAGDSALIRSQLAQRRPVIVLLEDRPGRFHFVVIVGWTNRRVILHDPARAPFRVLDEAAFDTAWQKANRWTMLALPGDATERRVSGPAAIPERSTSVKAGPCAEMVDEGVRLSAAGALDESRRVLEVALESCPRAAAHS